MKIKHIFLLLSLMLLPITASAFTQEQIARTNAQLQKVFDDMGMTSMGIAVTHHDSIVFLESFGYKEMPSAGNPGKKLEEDDMFCIASVSKTFIATAIMRLQDEGLLNIEDDAQKYLTFPLRNPKHPDTPITIKQLLNHTSSITDNRSYWNIDSINPRRVKDVYKCYSDASPGEQYVYCNMNYTLLGAVLEGATGTRFDRVVDDILIKPLDIEGGFNVNLLDRSKLVTLYAHAPGNKDSLISYPEYYKPYYSQLMDNYTLGRSLGLEYPASGMKISPKELTKFMRLHMHDGKLDGHRVISKESEELMRRNYVGSYNYGLSFRHYDNIIPGKRMYGQTGGSHGAKTCMIFEPEEEIGFVVFSSGADCKDRDGFSEIHAPVMKILYNNLFAE